MTAEHARKLIANIITIIAIAVGVLGVLYLNVLVIYNVIRDASNTIALLPLSALDIIAVILLVIVLQNRKIKLRG